jgi:SAM-dependent methyltransferase
VPKGARILDAGGGPGFTSLAIKLLGYNVIYLDLYPEPYREILEAYGVQVLKCDLERDRIPLSDGVVDTVVFSEVLEHLNPWYVPHTLSELNRVTRSSGLLFLTTPNIASIGKRVKLLLGRNPLGKMHVREYTMSEVVDLLHNHGYEILYKKYSMAYDLTPYHAHQRAFLLPLLKATIKHPTKENIFKTLVLPFVKLIPQIRSTIFVAAKKVRNVKMQAVHKRF